MTTMSVIDGNAGETLTVAVARRLRGQMAERRLSGTELGKRTGWGRQMISRRLNGETALNTDEIELIERVTGISAVYLLTGRRNDETPRPDGPGSSEVRPKGFEPLTFWSGHEDDLTCDDPVVVPMFVPAPAVPAIPDIDPDRIPA